MSNAHGNETNTQVARFLAPETSTEQTTLYAQPYNLDARGFYFSSVADYETKSAGLRDRFGVPVEEFEIQYIDGEDAELFETCRIGQADLGTWFDRVEPLDEREKAALFYLVSEVGYHLDDALDKLDDVCLQEATLAEAAEELFDECYAHDIPENLRCYIDYEKFARDCDIGGDMREFRFDGRTWTCVNAAGV